jgi:hypothetical protein
MVENRSPYIIVIVDDIDNEKPDAVSARVKGAGM